MGVSAAETGKSDPILTRLAAEDKVGFWKKPNLLALYLLLFPTCMGIELTSGFDSQMINALQIVPYWKKYFGGPTETLAPELKGIIAAAYALGAIVSLPIAPVVNERLGRRWAIFIGSAIQCIGAILQGFAQNAAMYIIARMILGFGIPMCIIAGSSLIGELAYPKERPVLTSLFNVSFFPGSIIAAGITFATNNIQSDWAWRIPSLLQLCPSVMQMALIFFLPESPRWLVKKDRYDEAEDILIKYHAEGDRESEFVKAEMAQIRSTIKLELETTKSSWMDLVRKKGMRRRLLVSSFLGLFTQWSGNTLISYYLGDLLKLIGYTESTFVQKINLSISCNNLFWAVIVSLLVLRVRRRVMYLACTASLLVVYISWTIAMEKAETGIKTKVPNNSANIAVLFFIYAYSPCYNIGYNSLTYTYLVELWPFAERSYGIAAFQFWGRGASFFTTFVNPIGMDNVGWKYLISYCCWLGFENVFVYFYFPETYGRTLEELAFLFEDKALADEAVAAVQKTLDHNTAPEVQSKEKTVPDVQTIA
ncbi:general substrate transporter [Thozetella sp. PMI_491]|nr:general substrate transporter [Thozetella sp. PMI_491]